MMGARPTDAEAVERKFVEPSKKITTPHDMDVWQQSQAFWLINGFLIDLNTAIVGLKISDIEEPSSRVNGVLKLLEHINVIVDEYPPVNMVTRFGNLAYRPFFECISEASQRLIQDLLFDSLNSPAAVELAPYLVHSLGNAQRIDYGTGHELTFLCFLTVLREMGYFDPSDYAAVGLLVFDSYFRTVRRLQIRYRMEPAGSHGVWGLDDYQFLPFLLGSSQLMRNSDLLPDCVHSERTISLLSSEFVYFSAIEFVQKMKKGPFWEHSPVLFEISKVPNWSKVNSGLRRMYVAEVLGKFPIIQHFLFGSVLRFELADQRDSV